MPVIPVVQPVALAYNLGFPARELRTLEAMKLEYQKDLLGHGMSTSMPVFPLEKICGFMHEKARPSGIPAG
jgi:hypothetical protein